jgi:gliding motility-associated-like protein
MTKSTSLSSKIYEQRFEMLKKLIRIDMMLRSAKIIHKDKGTKDDGSMRCFFSLLFIFCISFTGSDGQTTSLSGCGGSSVMEKTFGGGNNDDGGFIVQLPDSSYYIAGVTSSFGAGNSDIQLSKIDVKGTLLWTKTYGGTSVDNLFGMSKMSDGSIILSGTTSSFGVSSLDIFLVKVDAGGNILWSKTYGGSDEDQSRDVKETSDGGYLIDAFTYSFSGGGADWYIIKIDVSGNVQWTKSVHSIDNDFPYVIRVTSDGGFIIAGTCQPGSYDYLIVKFDVSGNVQWNTSYGFSYDEAPRDMVIATDGGYIIGGHLRRINNGSDYDALLVKLDQNGAIQWSKVFGGTSSDDIRGLAVTSDGNYAATGLTQSYGAGGQDAFLVKFDINGNFLFSQTYGKTGNEAGAKIIQTADSGYAITGPTNSSGAGLNDVYFIKTDCNGNTGCTSSLVNFIIYPFTFTVVSQSLSYSSGQTVTSQAPTVTSPVFTANNVCVVCNINSDFIANDSSVCVNDTVYFTNTSTGASQSKWLLNGNIFSNSQNSSYVFTSPGTYKIFLNVNSGTCQNSDSLVIIVNALPLINTSDDTLICETTSILLNTTMAAQYTWSPNIELSCFNCQNPLATPSVSRKYTVIGVDNNGCENSDSVLITIKCCINGLPGPKADFIIADSMLCIYDSLEVSDNSFASASATYLWDFGAFAIPATSVLKNPLKVKYSQSGRYSVLLIVNDPCGKDTSIKYINIFSEPITRFSDIILCAFPDSIQIDQTPVLDYSYKWTPEFGLSDFSIANPKLKIADTTITYAIEITDINSGCGFIDSMSIRNQTNVIAEVSQDTIIDFGNSVNLNACCGVSYKWTPSTYLNDPNIFNPVSLPERSITYFVEVKDLYNCIDIDTINITVDRELFIPNLVTCNKDAHNDYFYIKGLCSGSKLEIYNRWGDLIYKNDNYRNEWSGEAETDAIYYFIFRDSCTEKTQKGWVHLVH